MTPEHIRVYQKEIGWKTEDPKILLIMLVEIAAQLAEINEKLPRPCTASTGPK
jgi:hypothetical protein